MRLFCSSTPASRAGTDHYRGMFCSTAILYAHHVKCERIQSIQNISRNVELDGVDGVNEIRLPGLGNVSEYRSGSLIAECALNKLDPVVPADEALHNDMRQALPQGNVAQTVLGHKNNVELRAALPVECGAM